MAETLSGFFVERLAMAKLLGVLVAALLAWGLAAADALAEGRWQQVENKANCEIWYARPRPNETVTWTGKCVNGKAGGYGKEVWRYLKDGEWKGSSYTGTVKDGMRHGRGVLEYTWGWKYEGDFKDGKISGRGVEETHDGGRYEGEWKDDNWHGHGVYVYPKGSRYEGEWKETKRHGRGVLVAASGNRYDGDWKDDKMHGRGVFVWASGDRYEGDWKDGKMHGRGVFVWPSGDRYEGDWNGGKPNGSGTGTIGWKTYSGYWTNGCFKQGDRWAALFATKEACGF